MTITYDGATWQYMTLHDSTVHVNTGPGHFIHENHEMTQHMTCPRVKPTRRANSREELTPEKRHLRTRASSQFLFAWMLLPTCLVLALPIEHHKTISGCPPIYGFMM